MGRTFVCCDKPCGVHYPVPKKGKTLLERFGYVDYGAGRNAGASWYFCGECGQALEGFQESLDMFSLMVGTGLWIAACRLYPAWCAKQRFPMRKRFEKYSKSSTFAETRHCQAHYRLDRMSVYLYGPCRDMCMAARDELGLLFCVALARTVLNNVENLEKFLLHYRADKGALPTPSTWSEAAAQRVLTQLQLPFVMGYTARFLPQNFTGESGKSEELGLQLLSRFAKCLVKHQPFPWKALQGNEKTLDFLRKGFGLPHLQNAFFFAVLARDLGVLWGEDVFNDRLCAMMGENAREGLRDLLPSVPGVRGRKWADRLQLLTSWLWEQQCAHQPAGLLEGLGVRKSLQLGEHNACEWMQQHHRPSTCSRAPARPRRPDSQLRWMWHSAGPLLVENWQLWSQRLGETLMSDHSMLMVLQGAGKGQKRREEGWEVDFADVLLKRLKTS
ncbi:unnamed protein product [Effrenium voratum]|uniref:Uncharacterized protein n=1 Tax=Effrenium voratum TaxID=2562239 RepID=A0AA36HNL0_9DINO|nr:unnamed protein product [Effrenium voratum]CAJ1454856.1 unnamed protein product [Effrenium voratum]